MSDQLEQVLSKIETGLKNEYPPIAGAPVGHSTPFTGDMSVMLHCVQEAYSRVRGGDYTSQELHTHVAQAYGEASVAFLSDDGPQPVGAFPWLQVILTLIQLLGEKQE